MTRGDREPAALADPAKGQHFLVSAPKLSELVAAAGILPTDDVLEVGAGIGTVARALPRSRSLTVVEFDKRFIEVLMDRGREDYRRRFPSAAAQRFPPRQGGPRRYCCESLICWQKAASSLGSTRPLIAGLISRVPARWPGLWSVVAGINSWTGRK